MILRICKFPIPEEILDEAAFDAWIGNKIKVTIEEERATVPEYIDIEFNLRFSWTVLSACRARLAVLDIYFYDRQIR